MTPYCFDVFTDQEIGIFKRCCTLIEKVKSEDIRCHELATAAVTHIDAGREILAVRHGYFSGCFEHSWIEFKKSKHIIDVYAVGQYPQVQLINREIAQTLYRRGELSMRCWADEAIVLQLLGEMSIPKVHAPIISKGEFL